MIDKDKLYEVFNTLLSQGNPLVTLSAIQRKKSKKMEIIFDFKTIGHNGVVSEGSALPSLDNITREMYETLVDEEDIDI